MPAVTKTDADAYDKIMDAAVDLADLIETCRIDMDEYALEELTIFLAINAHKVKDIFRHLKRRW